MYGLSDVCTCECFFLSEELANLLSQPSYSHLKGFSPGTKRKLTVSHGQSRSSISHRRHVLEGERNTPELGALQLFREREDVETRFLEESGSCPRLESKVQSSGDGAQNPIQSQNNHRQVSSRTAALSAAIATVSTRFQFGSNQT